VNTYTGFASPNGTFWTEIGSHAIGFQPAKIGLVASNQGQPTAGINADVDHFTFQFATQKVNYLPIVNK
jgi:hypothetical protein